MSAHLETLACNNCGAQLTVPPDAHYVTCSHCRSQLAVHHDPTASYTTKLDEIDRRTEQMAEDLAHLRRQSQSADHQPITPQLENVLAGQRLFGSVIGLLFAGFAVLFGIFFASSSASMGAPAIFPLAGGFFALIGIVTGARILWQAVGRGRGD
jgi:DNA-directed RNA polymerase subunit RPC12/RpoP